MVPACASAGPIRPSYARGVEREAGTTSRVAAFGVDVEELWESSPDALVVVERGGRILAANQAAHLLFGHSAHALVGRSIEDLVPDDLREAHASHRTSFECDPLARPMGTGLRLQGRRADGTTFPVHISLAPLDGDQRTLAAVRDMSAWVEAEERLRLAERDRDLAEDHERIARELHDTVIQELFAAGIGLQALQATSPQPKRLGEVVAALDGTIRTIRTVIFDLSSPVHTRSGLRSRVADLVADVARTLDIEPRCHFTGPLDTGVPDDLVEEALAVVREGLTNVARHASATTVDLRIDVADQLVVEVVDDGVGIEDEPARRSGLANLADRAARHGGSFNAYRNPMGGTVVEWSVPMPGAVATGAGT